MITSDGIRGYNDVIILSLLKEGDSYGYAISKQIRARTNDLYVIKETTLYSAFTRLGKQALIEAYPGELTHGKKRTYYRITDKGNEFLKMKRQEWEQTKFVVDEFLEGGTENENY
ncbi:PadR family transcriptional regulator [Enterococcus saccharolyticus]|uniref:PadR family transcriptional regulator n=1 Tax=Enterococcus saccharolyticus subsp. saccharolyticus ATCC 43076 TaxID=1139996 RepID=S0NI71_9ENTE|nr:PadR family transcriptional regulator [Enterococcus saccharolyticus]EOT29409.1 PadR family transcriptional regulator [Enterococcus saccharolyticus subsp. saccharolyticus ATCC 43076]EOT81207.1 PadR family transcriptional regulator [Enterococcus saccharolyticus subsp. saccharolyticus ATCC 43076]OJG88467.1 PadR family transcriptional regulator [Enterococcus saccharolyticus]